MIDKQYHCLVINLGHAHARREIISARLQALGIPYEFLPGVDGRRIEVSSHPRYSQWKRRIFFGRDLSNGELGCILAHRNIYDHIVSSGLAYTLVLEDDALLSDSLPDVVNALLDIPDKWDMVRFLGREKNYRSARVIAPLHNTSARLARPWGTPGGAYGYLLNLRAAKRLLSMTRTNWLAIDTLHGATWLTGLNTLSVLPSPVLPNDDISSCIDEQDSHLRWNKSVTLSGVQRLAYPVSRGVLKLYFNIMVRWIWLRTLIPDSTERIRNRA